MGMIKSFLLIIHRFIKNRKYKQTHRILNEISAWSSSWKYKGYENAVMINIGAGKFWHPK